ncbi:MAG: hypothetical protein AAF549_09285 [Pseudomonadota bacterium]
MAFLELVKQIGPSALDAIRTKVSGLKDVPDSVHEVNRIAELCPANKISPFGFRPAAARLLQGDVQASEQIDALLKRWGHQQPKYLGGGSVSLILEVDNETIVRITPNNLDDARAETEIAVRSNKEEIIGNFRIQEIPKLSTNDVSWSDVWRVQLGLMKEGKFLLDIGRDNIGHLKDGTPVVIDHGAILSSTGKLSSVFSLAGRGLENLSGTNASYEIWRGKQDRKTRSASAIKQSVP